MWKDIADDGRILEVSAAVKRLMPRRAATVQFCSCCPAVCTSPVPNTAHATPSSAQTGPHCKPAHYLQPQRLAALHRQLQQLSLLVGGQDGGRVGACTKRRRGKGGSACGEQDWAAAPAESSSQLLVPRPPGFVATAQSCQIKRWQPDLIMQPSARTRFIEVGLDGGPVVRHRAIHLRQQNST